MIDFITANNGQIEMFSNNSSVAKAATATSIAYFLQENGFDGSVMASSSMDFASEEGFDSDDDAKILWEQGVYRFFAAERTKIDEAFDTFVS